MKLEKHEKDDHTNRLPVQHFQDLARASLPARPLGDIILATPFLLQYFSILSKG